MEPINNILNNHAMAPAQPLQSPTPPPTQDPLSPADDEFPDPFANTPEESNESADDQTDVLPTPDIEQPEATEKESESSATTEQEVQTSEEESAEVKPNSSQLQSLKRNIHTIQDQLAGMLRTIQMMQGMSTVMETSQEAQPSAPNFAAPALEETTEEGQVIEGVFDGMQMVGPDGKTYSIPPNYASKSKLVEGDFMKLTITPSGKFLYKQIGPIERKRIVGELVQGADEEQWSVLAEGRPYHVLKASVTFHSARPGDEVVILVPKDGESSWGAVENVMHK